MIHDVASIRDPWSDPLDERRATNDGPMVSREGGSQKRPRGEHLSVVSDNATSAGETLQARLNATLSVVN